MTAATLPVEDGPWNMFKTPQATLDVASGAQPSGQPPSAPQLNAAPAQEEDGPWNMFKTPTASTSAAQTPQEPADTPGLAPHGLAYAASLPLGAVEALSTMVTGTIGSVAGDVLGATGMAEGVLNDKEANDLRNKVAVAMTDQPEMQSGKDILSGVQTVLSPITDMVKDFSQWVGGGDTLASHITEDAANIFLAKKAADVAPTAVSALNKGSNAAVDSAHAVLQAAKSDPGGAAVAVGAAGIGAMLHGPLGAIAGEYLVKPLTQDFRDTLGQYMSGAKLARDASKPPADVGGFSFTDPTDTPPPPGSGEVGYGIGYDLGRRVAGMRNGEMMQPRVEPTMSEGDANASQPVTGTQSAGSQSAGTPEVSSNMNMTTDPLNIKGPSSVGEAVAQQANGLNLSPYEKLQKSLYTIVNMKVEPGQLASPELDAREADIRQSLEKLRRYAEGQVLEQSRAAREASGWSVMSPSLSATKAVLKSLTYEQIKQITGK